MSDPLYKHGDWRDLDIAAHVLLRMLNVVFRNEKITPLLDAQAERALTACRNATNALCEGIDGGNFETVDNTARPEVDSDRVLRIEHALHIARERLVDDPEGLALIDEACDVALPFDLDHVRQLLYYRDRAFDDGSAASGFSQLMYEMLPELLVRALSDTWVSQSHSWVNGRSSRHAQLNVMPTHLTLFLVDDRTIVHRYTQPNPNGADDGNETTTNDANSNGG